VFCERANRPIKHTEVDINSGLIKRVRMAANAPLLKGGVGVDENKLPDHTKKWLAIAWSDIKDELPTKAADEHAGEIFKRQVEQMLNTLHARNGERAHTIASWAVTNARLVMTKETDESRRTQLVQLDDYLIWAAALDDGPKLGVHVGLAEQVTPMVRAFENMPQKEFTEKARKYGLAEPARVITGFQAVGTALRCSSWTN
jgi:hypothetical protein